jgi:predicted ATPase
MEHYEKALLVYDPKRHLDDGFLYALNPGVAMPCFAAWALWFLGQPEQALERMREALILARELSEPISLAHALLFAAILHQLRREEHLAREHADAAIAVSNEHGLALYQAMATVMRGWALLSEGRDAEAIEEMREGLAALQATGTELVRPHFLGLLAEALGHARQPEEGLRAVDEALSVIRRGGEGYYEAELYRLKGELLLIQAAPNALAEAEACFHQSIKIAQRQKANSWELRAVMSLSRLYQSESKQEEARTLLARIYSTFTEGFATMDLREAKALLDEWSSSSSSHKSN